MWRPLCAEKVTSTKFTNTTKLLKLHNCFKVFLHCGFIYVSIQFSFAVFVYLF